MSNFIVLAFPKSSRTCVVAREDKNKDNFTFFGKQLFITLKIDIKESPEPILSITFFANAGQETNSFFTIIIMGPIFSTGYN